MQGVARERQGAFPAEGLDDVGGLRAGRGLVTRGHTCAGGLGGPSCLRIQSEEPESPLSDPMPPRKLS